MPRPSSGTHRRAGLRRGTSIHDHLSINKNQLVSCLELVRFAWRAQRICGELGAEILFRTFFSPRPERELCLKNNFMCPAFAQLAARQENQECPHDQNAID